MISDWESGILIFMMPTISLSLPSITECMCACQEKPEPAYMTPRNCFWWPQILEEQKKLERRAALAADSAVAADGSSESG
jgi:hypothetical protein